MWVCDNYNGVLGARIKQLEEGEVTRRKRRRSGILSKMEVSDLATSAGINIGLAILFLVLYSVFRKLPGNRGVYNTREMLRESQCKEGKKEEEKQPFALENLVPSAGWVQQAWDLSDDDILQSAGLDALVFLRIFVFGSVVESLSSHKKPLSMKHFAHCKERNRMIMSDR